MKRKRGPKGIPDADIIGIREMLKVPEVSYADINKKFKRSFSTIARISTGDLVPRSERTESGR